MRLNPAFKLVRAVLICAQCGCGVRLGPESTLTNCKLTVSGAHTLGPNIFKKYLHLAFGALWCGHFRPCGPFGSLAREALTGRSGAELGSFVTRSITGILSSILT